MRYVLRENTILFFIYRCVDVPEAQTIPGLIENMQRCTKPGGYKLNRRGDGYRRFSVAQLVSVLRLKPENYATITVVGSVEI